jgi:hypothetical protein
MTAPALVPSQTPKLEAYGDLLDLYAARAVRARMSIARDAEPIKIVAIGRGSAAAAVRNSSRHIEPGTRRFKFAAASLVVAMFGSWFAHDTFAAPPTRHQIHAIVMSHDRGPIEL